MRLQHHIGGTLYPLWVLLVADDLIAISTRPTFRRALLLVFLVLDVLGFPLIWNKVCVAPVLKWVGYALLFREAKPCITASRALWMERLLAERVVRVGDFEGLGRASFVCGALDYDRRFLAPLHNFVARLRDPEDLWQQAWRVDAHASDGGVGIGGWWPEVDDQGGLRPELSLLVRGDAHRSERAIGEHTREGPGLPPQCFVGGDGASFWRSCSSDRWFSAARSGTRHSSCQPSPTTCATGSFSTPSSPLSSPLSSVPHGARGVHGGAWSSTPTSSDAV